MRQVNTVDSVPVGMQAPKALGKRWLLRYALPMKTAKPSLSQMSRKLLYAIGMLTLLFGLVAGTEHLPQSSPAPLIIMGGLFALCAAAVCGRTSS